jgi:hypothetical protein
VPTADTATLPAQGVGIRPASGEERLHDGYSQAPNRTPQPVRG